MKINLLAIGKRMPTWVQAAFTDYANRLPHDFQLICREISAEKRPKNANLDQITVKEGQRLLKAVPKDNILIALDRQGQLQSTATLANHFTQWYQQQQDISLLIGGPEGLADDCLQQCQLTWSLSQLTFAHPLVRVILAEQIYRTWSIINNHPYHR